MGFWIRPDGKQYEIPDHYNFLQENLKLFGFTKKESKSWTLADRVPIIEEATKKGWIRVRGKSPNMSMEFWKWDGNTISNMKEFLIGQQIDPNEKILFEENSTGKPPWYEPASWILSDKVLEMSGRRRR